MINMKQTYCHWTWSTRQHRFCWYLQMLLHSFVVNTFRLSKTIWDYLPFYEIYKPIRYSDSQLLLAVFRKNWILTPVFGFWHMIQPIRINKNILFLRVPWTLQILYIFMKFNEEITIKLWFEFKNASLCHSLQTRVYFRYSNYIQKIVEECFIHFLLIL